jgi:hypothetical protein
MHHLKRFLIVFFIVIVSALSVSAQTNVTSSDGLISLTLPAGWVSAEDGTTLIIANNLEALDIGQRRSSATPATIVLLVSATANMSEVGNDADIAPSELIDLFLSATGMSGDITETEINGFEVVQATVSTPDTQLSGTEAAVAAIATANGTVFIIMETGDTLADYSAELMSIAESLTSAGAPADAQASAASGDGTIAYNQSVTGAFSDDVTEQFYTFTGTAGDVVTITMVADDNDALDTWVWLLTSEGFAGDELVPLIDNDDAADTSLGSYNSQIVDFALPETGEYTIRATRLGFGTGGYTLTLSNDAAPVVAETASSAEPVIVRQWATGAMATTQYGSDSWSAMQATGEPNASTSCSDNRNAWASATTKTEEFLTVSYDQAVIPTEIHIYQVYNPGSITSVLLTNSDTGEVMLLPDSADPVGNTPCPGVFTVNVSDATTAFNQVTIFIDQSTVASWTEIDAVELVGIDPTAASAAPTGTAGAGILGADAVSHALDDGTTFTFPADYLVIERFGTYVKLEDPSGSIAVNYSINTASDRTGADNLARAAGLMNMTVRIDPNLVGDPYGDGSVLTYQPVVGQYVVTFTVNGRGNYITAIVKPNAADPAALDEVVTELSETARLLASGQ